MKTIFRASVLLCLVISMLSSISGAVRLYLGQPEGIVTRGQLIAIPVYLDTGGGSMVVSDLFVSFNPDHFKVLGMDAGSSMFANEHFVNPLVVRVDEESGRAEIVCGVPTPGVTGNQLLMGHLVGGVGDQEGMVSVDLIFTSAGQQGECHLVLDDGKGTDVLQGVSGAWFTVDGIDSTQRIFPHFLKGGGYETTVTLINPEESSAVNGVMAIRGQDGAELTCQLAEKWYRGYTVFELNTRQAMRWRTGSDGELQSGTVQAVANGSLDGVILFDSPGGTAAVGAMTPSTSIMAPVQRQETEGVNSGLAFFNPSRESRTFSLMLRDSEGHTLAQKSFTISPLGQFVRYVDELFPESNTADFQGSIGYSEQFPLASMVIRTGQDSGGSFATMPIVDQGRPELFFAQFADGMGISSTIILLNPSSETAVNGVVYLRKENGQFLTTDINGSSVTGDFEFSLPPSGTAFFKTDGRGPLVAGNIRVEADAALGGTILFSGNSGTAGVGHSQPTPGFLVPVEKHLLRQVNTGISVINTGPAEIVIELQLLDDDGVVLAESGEITIVPEGQYVRLLEGIFPQFEFTGEFTGMIRMSSSVQVAAMAIRMAPESFATLPVIPLVQ